MLTYKVKDVLCPKPRKYSRRRRRRKLRSAGFEKCEIKNVTGHANVQGLDAYDSGNEEDLHSMSSVISKPKNRSLSTENRLPNFSFGIDWSKQASSSHPNFGKTYVFNNCTNITLNVDQKDEPPVKRRRVMIISSDESQE